MVEESELSESEKDPSWSLSLLDLKPQIHVFYKSGSKLLVDTVPQLPPSQRLLRASSFGSFYPPLLNKNMPRSGRGGRCSGGGGRRRKGDGLGQAKNVQSIGPNLSDREKAIEDDSTI